MLMVKYFTVGRSPAFRILESRLLLGSGRSGSENVIIVINTIININRMSIGRLNGELMLRVTAGICSFGLAGGIDPPFYEK